MKSESSLISRADEFKAVMRELLSKKRFQHSLNVADSARALAQIHGADMDKAYIAGLLHDIKKEETPAAMKSMAILSDMDLEEIEVNTPNLWHAPASAYFIRKSFGIEDEEILNAVRFHTIGRAEMSLVERVVYLADLVSADRSYPDVGRMRKSAYENIDLAMFEALQFALQDLSKKAALIPNYTLQAYNYYTRIYKEGL